MSRASSPIRPNVPLTLFAGAAILLIAGTIGSVQSSGGWRAVWIIAAIVGVLLLGLALALFRAISFWNKRRRAGWSQLDVSVAIDDAAGQESKTLVDSTDGKWRIALAKYPPELRDEIRQRRSIDYVGELGDGASILLRPTGVAVEFFGMVKDRSRLESTRS